MKREEGKERGVNREQGGGGRSTVCEGKEDGNLKE